MEVQPSPVSWSLANCGRSPNSCSRGTRLDKRGRPPVDDRAVLTGIVFVLRSGIPWELLPQEMGCGSGVTCWRRLRSWQRRGAWKKLLHALLDRPGSEGLIDWSRLVVDS